MPGSPEDCARKEPPGISGTSISEFHDAFLAGGEPDWLPTGREEVWHWIDQNHRWNAALWQEEDLARRTDVPHAEIARCKRSIDRHNQRRNDAVEAIDERILARLSGVARRPGARRSSETAGAMIDRLSILALKLHHMRAQTSRVDASAEHVRLCQAKLEQLNRQRDDLCTSLDTLLDEAARGAAYFTLYRQFKMYNDPHLNPQLYRRRIPEAALPAPVDVLIPTFDRPAALGVTLATLLAQTLRGFRVVISDQGEIDAVRAAEVRSVARLLLARGCEVETHRHVPRRGLAEHRHFLLQQARAPYALFLDDDVILEADVLERLLRAMLEQRCGFVGSALIGMSYANDVRPQQQHIEFWEGAVLPEEVLPGSPEWARHHLHSAANLYHVQKRLDLAPGEQRLYRVAWIGGCVLFDVAKLRAAGGFDFWPDLPAEHCGEDVLVQLRVMARYGGCGILPSGAYHQELPTTIPRREVDAPTVLPL